MNPYINLKSYTEANSKFFKGRDNEIDDVLSILKRSDVIVLYSESAEGKSSLLGAGLSPRFRQMGYIPVTIVFTDDEFRNPNPDFDKIVIDRIEDVLKHSNDEILSQGAENSGLTLCHAAYTLAPPSFSKKYNESEFYEWVSTTDIDIPDDNTSAKKLSDNAWWLLRNFAVERYAAKFHFVLIFDQFEEVFSQPNLEWTNSLFEWLENLYSDKCPSIVSKCLSKLYKDEESEPKFNMNRSFKEIFSMRNEYIGDLDYWGVQKHFMPELKNSRYCLKPLTISEATDVINLGFKDREDIRNQILSAATGINIDQISSADANIARVQPMLLSVICSALSHSGNEHNYLAALKAGDKDTLQRIIYDVYRTQMNENKIPGTHRKKIEQALIDSNGKRVRIKTSTPPLNDICFDSRYKNALKRAGITRSSKINGEEYVELVHDQLANAIYHHEVKSKNLRKSIASVFMVVLACLLIFGLWVSSSMTVDTPNIKIDELNKYSLALLDEKIRDVSRLSGKELQNNSITEHFTLENYDSRVDIGNNSKLRTLIITPPNDSNEVTINIYNNVLLKKVIIGDSVSNLKVDIDDNIGFCQIELGKNTKKIKITPRRQYTEIVPLDSNYKCFNNRWWCYSDSTILYIPKQLAESQFFSFPFSFKSIKYNNSLYYNVPRNVKTVDLSEFGQIRKIEAHEFEGSGYYEIILPENLETIEDYAFTDCKNLKQVVIPASVTKIGSCAFDDNCELVFNRNFSNVEIITRNDTTITRLTIPQRRGTLDLTEFRNIKEISGSAFSHARFDSIILPNDLEIIEDYAFTDCKNLKQVVIPASVTKIGSCAFDDNCELVFNRNFSNVEIITRNDTTITRLTIPQRRGTLDLTEFRNIKEIGGSAFSHARFDSIILPDDLETIGSTAFTDCKNLKQVVIPASVKRISKLAFDDSCELVFNRNFSNDEIITRNDTTIIDLTIPQRRGTLDLSKFTKIRSIDDLAFSECRYDTVILPKSLKSIGWAAFKDCKNLKQIVIPASIKTILFSAIPSNCEVIFNGKSNQKIGCGISYANSDAVIAWRHDTIDYRSIKNPDGFEISDFITGNSSCIILPSTVKYFWCSNIMSVHIENESLSDLINKKKYFKCNDFIISSIENLPHYKKTYFRVDSLIVANDYSSDDIYFRGTGYLGASRAWYKDSVLRFSDKSNLDKIKSIHLSLPRPRIWTADTDSTDTLKSSEFSIDLPDSIKRGITLYVPHGSKNFYEDTPSFKAFGQICEDSRLCRYKDILFVRLIGCFYWLGVPLNSMIVSVGLIIVVAFFYTSFKISYKRQHPYSTQMRTDVLSILNGLIMAIVATMGFIAVYWWIWDLTGNKFLISALCGVIGALIALALCYLKILPSMWNLLYKKTLYIFKKVKRQFF